MEGEFRFTKSIPYLIAVIVIGYGIYWIVFGFGKSKRDTPNTPGKEIRTALLPVTIQKTSGGMGLGFFRPDIYNRNVLYCYKEVGLHTSVGDLNPADSITFEHNDNNRINVTHAPSWFKSHQMQLDYDHWYFPLVTVSDSFVEVVKNTNTNATMYVERQAGIILYWQDFFLDMHSVVFLPNSKEKVHKSPSETSQIIHTSRQLLKPIAIQEKWMLVGIMDDNFNMVSTGWIRWKIDGKLSILFNPLS